MAHKNEDSNLIVRAVNVDADEWAQAQVIATEAGMGMSELVRNVLKVLIEKGSIG